MLQKKIGTKIVTKLSKIIETFYNTRFFLIHSSCQKKLQASTI